MYVILKLAVSFVVALSVLSSCSEITTSNFYKTKTGSIFQENKVFVDVGHGKKGGTVSFNVNLSEGFKTKANVNGWYSVYNSINSYKIALVSSAGTGSNALTTLPLGTSADIFSITKSAMSGTKTSPTAQIFLTNVPAGTYWIAVAAFDAQGRNVTKSTTTTGTISVAGGEIFAVSYGGGNGETSPYNGRVTVAADFSVPATPVTIPLTLIDSFGANIQSTVTITDGSTNVKADIALIRFYLVNSKTTSNLVDANIIKGPFDLSSGTLFDSLKAGTATTLTFASVPAGTYYVAGAAYNSSGTVDSTTNITNLTTNTFANITITTAPTPTGNMGTFSISNSSGDGDGSLVVNSTYLISSASAVVLPLKLKD